MYAEVDFHRNKSFFFNCFQKASNFIAQYPVIENVVVVDLSEKYPQVEML